MKNKLQSRIEFGKILDNRRGRILFRNIGLENDEISKKNNKVVSMTDDYCFNAIIIFATTQYYIEYIPFTSDVWYRAYLISEDIIEEYNTKEIKDTKVFTKNKVEYYNIYTDTLYSDFDSLPDVQLKTVNMSLKKFLQN